MPESLETNSFDKSLKDLEKIILELEKGELSLEKQLQVFEKGVALSRECLMKLEEVERKVEVILKNSQGEMTTKPFEE